MNTKKVWFVTGASKGLGLTLVKALLARDYQVVATSRKRQSLIDAIGNSGNFLALEMDLTNNDDVVKKIETAVNHFGRIDVVVNNAGYSQIGTLEELSDAEVKRNFEVNVFGALNVIRNAAKYLRKQQSGHIFNIASIGGFAGNFPGFGIYCSTKFAVAGFTEALAVEIKPFGVNTTLVYPGYFRTDFLSKGSVQTPATPIEAYATAREVEAAHLNEIDGNQPNDPEKAAEVLIAVTEENNPPVHLFLGEDAYDMVFNKIKIITDTVELWKKYTLSTAY
ncbi:SDR family NAD(P)-dependent oxidoreductase [Olivibacter sp. SDN3]|uniref:SDR family NAD(P)-dependent oxidoreductase n=1 Tax=Olivibacter sp. SDN3 TaxID=2764720 RepID=UPI00165120D3|nr:SDR family NAD(P)-dependent oxidoreductase [Olivibacter sp. SDN3]QNL51786.1 SDR family NAD(P)-dependent oxidoreductase [Olivibacter sp. SDN3]